jgi:hypothetical protein
MKSKNQILLESKIRKMVREELSVDDIKSDLNNQLKDFTIRVKNMEKKWAATQDVSQLNKNIQNIEVHLEKIKDSLSKIAF